MSNQLACLRGYGLVKAVPEGRHASYRLADPHLAPALDDLSFAERSAGRELGSATAVAEPMQTLMCTYLSAAVLAGLVLNSLLGWWWADSIAGLVIAAFAIREGIEAWRGDACATSVGMILENGAH